MLASLGLIGTGVALIYLPTGVIAVGALLWIDLFHEGVRKRHEDIRDKP
jgi:hypothetical protein